MEKNEYDMIIREAIMSEQYVRVRRRILRQLIESAIYEDLLQPEIIPVEQELAFHLTGMDAQNQPTLYICLGQPKLSFGRIRLSQEPVLQKIGEEFHEVSSISQLVFDLFRGTAVISEKLVAFTNELEQTLFKDTLAQYIRKKEGLDFYTNSYDDLECNAMDGHPYHPCYKSRIGFDYIENLAYGPEYKKEIRPLWVAVHRQYTYACTTEYQTFDEILVQELGNDCYGVFQQVIRSEGCDPKQYCLLPVHPWQWQKQIAPTYLQDLREKKIIVLGEGEDVYYAQQSIRTLANRTYPAKAYIKLSMNLFNTSTMRLLTPHSVAAAPLLSDWLQDIVEHDTYLRDVARVILLREFAGVCYDPPKATKTTYGSLGCIWRESIHTYLEPNEEAVPFHALCSLHLDGTPYITPWIMAMGIDQWLQKLIETCVLPVVHLMVKHGISLEAHAQNMILIHVNGVPVRSALKDFHETVEYVKSSLLEPDKCPDFSRVHSDYKDAEPNKYFEMDDVVHVRDLTLETLFLINLGELALLLDEHFTYPERKFWSLVASLIHQHRLRFPELAERFERFDLFVPTFAMEQLTKARLFSNTSLHLHQVSNPLYTFHCIKEEKNVFC